MKKLKTLIVNSVKNFWSLNCEAKIGILLLIPPIIGVIMFVLNLFDAGLGFQSFPQSWNCVYDYETGWPSKANGCAATPATPFYLGLMAIAGAYLIKGNIKRQ